MTDLMTRPDIADQHTSPGDDIHHVTCCLNEDMALCATDVASHPWWYGAKTTCIVCADLEKQPEIICPFTKKPCAQNGSGGDDAGG